LYFAEIPCGVVFSSELKAIVKYHINKPQINIERLAAPIRYIAPLSKNKTFIDQVHKIEPGQYILVDESGLTKHQYWIREVTNKYKGTFEKAKDDTLALMRNSVDICLRSDVPVAVMLSGGIDSSAIAALAKESGREIHTITAGYKGQHDCDERTVAKKFAKEKGLIYHELELDEKDLNLCFEELTQYIDEPISDAAAVAQWALYKKVKSLGFKVLLGGIGGDELFYGYPYWNDYAEALQKQQQFHNHFPWIGLNKKIQYLKFFFKNKKYILKAGHPMKLDEKTLCFWNDAPYNKFSKEAFFQINEEKYAFNSVILDNMLGNADGIEALDRVYDFAFNNIMVMAYLYLSDRLGMGNSLEIRSPLLDYKLVEFVSGLPNTIKYKKNQPKYFLKEVLKGTVPDYILYGPKRGFAPPWNFIKDIEKNYEYKVFRSEFKFYNSILTDKVLYNILSKNNEFKK
jgi:asparagine synthase (glutamine-hydrolysing)